MSAYTDKLNALCNWALTHPGCGSTRAIEKIVMDLEGDGPVGELLHTLDATLFAQVLDLFVEFKATGRSEAFNSIHGAARGRLAARVRAIGS